MRCFVCSCLLALVALLAVVHPVQAEGLMKKWTNKIECDPSKSYTLDKAHGPWMVMVASFRSTVGDEKKMTGTSPAQTAHSLVIELRKLGVPAYSFEVKAEQEVVKVQDGHGRESRKKNLHRVDSICVLAGNYSSIDPDDVGSKDGKDAQKTLAYIKKMHPESLTKGVLYAKSPGRPGPLSGAFLAPNPLLSMEELESAKKAFDPVLYRLNSEEQFSLYENKGKYTLVIARFAGKQINVVNESVEKAEKYFTDGGNDLGQASITAQSLVHALRSREPLPLNSHPEAAEFQKYCKMDAYIWHDYTFSVVTVGSFATPNDPEVRRLAEMFGSQASGGAGKRKTVTHRYLPVVQDDKSFTFIPFSPTPELMIVPTAKR